MEPPKYRRKFEELQRNLNKIKGLYGGQIINESGQDSFQSPKDIILNFFRVSYELKEALKNEATLSSNLMGYNGEIEKFCSNDQWVALSLDVANQAKHGSLKNGRSNKTIGQINAHITLCLPSVSGKVNGKNRTELTIEIDGNKEDCLRIVNNCFNSWQVFLQYHQLL